MRRLIPMTAGEQLISTIIMHGSDLTGMILYTPERSIGERTCKTRNCLSPTLCGVGDFDFIHIQRIETLADSGVDHRTFVRFIPGSSTSTSAQYFSHHDIKPSVNLPSRT